MLSFNNVAKVEEGNEDLAGASETPGVSILGRSSDGDTSTVVLRPSAIASSPPNNDSSNQQNETSGFVLEQNIQHSEGCASNPLIETTPANLVPASRGRHFSVGYVRMVRRNRRRLRIRLFGEWVKLQIDGFVTKIYQKINQRIQNQLILAQGNHNAAQSIHQRVAASTQTACACSVETQTDLSYLTEKRKEKEKSTVINKDGHSKYSEAIVNGSPRKIANPFTSKMRDDKKKELEKKQLKKDQKPKFENSSHTPRRNIKSNYTNSHRFSFKRSQSKKYSPKPKPSPQDTTKRKPRYVPFREPIYDAPATPTPPIQRPIIPSNVMIPSGKPLDSFLPLVRDPITPPLLSPQIPETTNNKNSDESIASIQPSVSNDVEKKAVTEKKAIVEEKVIAEKKNIDAVKNNSLKISSVEKRQKTKDRDELTPRKRTKNKPRSKAKSTKAKDKSIITRKYEKMAKTNYNLPEKSSSSDFEVDETIAHPIQTKPPNSEITRRNASPGYYSAIFSSDEEPPPSSNFRKMIQGNKLAGCYNTSLSSDEKINDAEIIITESKSTWQTSTDKKNENIVSNDAQPSASFSPEKTASISPVESVRSLTPNKTAPLSPVKSFTPNKTTSISPVKSLTPNEDQKAKEAYESTVQMTTFTIPATTTVGTSVNIVTDEKKLTEISPSTPSSLVKSPEKVQMDISPEKPKEQLSTANDYSSNIQPNSLDTIAGIMPKSTSSHNINFASTERFSFENLFQSQNQQPQTFISGNSLQPTTSGLSQAPQQITENFTSSGLNQPPQMSLNFNFNFNALQSQQPSSSQTSFNSTTENFTFTNPQFPNAQFPSAITGNLNIQNIHERKIAAPRKRRK